MVTSGAPVAARATASGGTDWKAWACRTSAHRARATVRGTEPTACAAHPSVFLPGSHVRHTPTPSMTSCVGASGLERDVTTSTPWPPAARARHRWKTWLSSPPTSGGK